MSVKLMAAVWEDETFTSKAELLLCLAIADFANENGEAWPGTERLAMKCRSTQRAVIRMVSRLILAGKLEVKYNAGLHKTNVYKLLTPPLTAGHPDPSGTKNVPKNVPKKGPKKGPKKEHLGSPYPSGTISNHQEVISTHLESLGTTIEESTPDSAIAVPPEAAKEKTPHQVLIDSWCKGFEAFHHRKYAVLGARDGKGAKNLLAFAGSPEAAMAVALRAWAESPKLGPFLSQRATTLHGLAETWNEIQVKLAAPPAPAWQGNGRGATVQSGERFANGQLKPDYSKPIFG